MGKLLFGMLGLDFFFETIMIFSFPISHNPFFLPLPSLSSQTGPNQSQLW